MGAGEVKNLHDAQIVDVAELLRMLEAPLGDALLRRVRDSFPNGR